MRRAPNGGRLNNPLKRGLVSVGTRVSALAALVACVNHVYQLQVDAHFNVSRLSAMILIFRSIQDSFSQKACLSATRCPGGTALTRASGLRGKRFSLFGPLGKVVSDLNGSFARPCSGK